MHRQPNRPPLARPDSLQTHDQAAAATIYILIPQAAWPEYYIEEQAALLALHWYKAHGLACEFATRNLVDHLRSQDIHIAAARDVVKHIAAAYVDLDSQLPQIEASELDDMIRAGEADPVLRMAAQPDRAIEIEYRRLANSASLFNAGPTSHHAPPAAPNREAKTPIRAMEEAARRTVLIDEATRLLIQLSRRHYTRPSHKSARAQARAQARLARRTTIN